MEYLEYYKEMKDTVEEIKNLDIIVQNNLGFHSQIVINLFDDIAEDILDDKFNAGVVLYDVYNLLEVFSREKVKDIEILEQLKEKLERINKVVL
jgi:hypothetical protein|nr:MAG TPA: hypothetical protein [Caudoviricetes sp.]